MPDEVAQQATAQSPQVVVTGALRLRDPPFFSGTDDHDVEDWLATFEKVSGNNKWDDPSKLQNVSFYLKDVASLWYHNHQSDIPTWSEFKKRFADVFDRPALRKLRAEQRLRGRAQQQGENFTSYIEDVIDLCKRLNPSMPEQEKIKHVLKGIDDDAFQMLLAKDPRTVAELTTLCQSFDELRRQRVLVRRPTTPDDSLAALTIGGDHETLLSQIKEYVREEVARQISCLSYLPTPEVPTHNLAPSLRQVIQEQVSEVLPSASQPPPVAAPLTYAAAAAMPPRRPPALASQPLRQPPAPFPGAQQHIVNPWRTTDNRPICYVCGIPGHVARFCRRRFAAASGALRYRDYSFRPRYYTPQDAPPEVYARDPQTDSDFQPFASRRSPSPRRRSLSPMRRRPTAETEN